MSANPARGEALLDLPGLSMALRPTFAALVAAEEELGPLFALVERAAAGKLRLAEMAGLFWHCRHPDGAAIDRDALQAAIARGGLAACTPALKQLLRQILQGA